MLGGCTWCLHVLDPILGSREATSPIPFMLPPSRMLRLPVSIRTSRLRRFRSIRREMTTAGYPVRTDPTDRCIADRDGLVWTSYSSSENHTAIQTILFFILCKHPACFSRWWTVTIAKLGNYKLLMQCIVI